MKPVTVGPFRQEGLLDGVLIRVGGGDAAVPVHLQDGDVIHKCHADDSTARRLERHLFGGTVRVFGNGRWNREADGRWVLVRFDIKDFELLDDTPLPEVVRRLRSVQGSGWPGIDDPAAELRRMRDGDEDGD